MTDTLIDAIVYNIENNWSGLGGAKPATIASSITIRNATWDPNEWIVVYPPRVRLNKRINDELADIVFEIPIKVNTAVDADRLAEMVDEVRRIISTVKVAGAVRQYVGEDEAEVTDPKDQVYIWEMNCIVENNTSELSIAFEGTLDAAGNFVHTDVADEIHQVAEKDPAVAADVVLIEDSEDSWNKKRVALTDLIAGGGGGPGSGTQWILPVWDTTTTLGDSMISQNAAGTIATVAGTIKISHVDSISREITGSRLGLISSTTWDDGTTLLLYDGVDCFKLFYDGVEIASISLAGDATFTGDVILGANELQFSSATIHSSGTEIHIHPNTGNADGSVIIHPIGTNTASDIELRNNVAADFGAVQLKISGLTVSLESILGGAGTAPTTLNLNDADWDIINIGDASSAITLGGATTLSTIAAGVADYDKFLVSDTGIIKFRTAAEMLLDLDVYTKSEVDTEIDTDISTHASDDNAHHEVFELGDFTTAFAAEDFNNLATTAHVLASADHTVSGLTAGDILSADTATTYSWKANPGGADANAYHDDEADEIHQTALKGAPIGADELLIEDSEASWAKKRVTITSLGTGGPGSGTQWTLPVWDTGSTLGDSMVSQDAGGTILTVSGKIKDPQDNSGLHTGIDDDFRIYHNGTDSLLVNLTGDTEIWANTDFKVIADADVIFNINGEVYITDSGDGDVALFSFDTSARTLLIGQVADPVASTLQGTLAIADIAAEATDVDKFLVSNAGLVKFRTGAEVLSDIGAVGVPLALTDLASYAQGAIIMGGGADWEALGPGTEDYVLTMGVAEPYWKISASGGPGSGTQWTLPVWDTTSTLGDSMITQDSGGTAATVGGSLTINTIAAEATDVDKFLVSNAGLVKFRTGSEVASDIGAASVPLALTDLASYTQGSIIRGGGADWEPYAKGTSGQILRAGATDVAWDSDEFSKGAVILSPEVGFITIWRAHRACTIERLQGHQQGGTNTTINARKNGINQVASSDLILASANTWYATVVLSQTSLALNDELEVEVVSVGGATQVTIQLELTYP